MDMKVNPCNYCIHWDLSNPHFHKCDAGVPFFGANIYCEKFEDGYPVVRAVGSGKKKFNLKKILVDTF